MWGGVVLALSLRFRIAGGLDRLLLVMTACLSGSCTVIFEGKVLTISLCDQFWEWFENIEGEAVSRFGLLRLLEGSYLLCM